MIQQINTSCTNYLHDDFTDKFNNFSRLQHTVAYCLRFLHNSQHPRNKIIGPLRVSELHSLETKIIKFIQQEAFANEISQFKSATD